MCVCMCVCAHVRACVREDLRADLAQCMPACVRVLVRALIEGQAPPRSPFPAMRLWDSSILPWRYSQTDCPETMPAKSATQFQCTTCHKNIPNA